MKPLAVNLLPWRDVLQRRKERQLKHLIIIILVLTIMVSIMANYLVKKNIQSITQENSYISQTIGITNPRVNNLKHKINLINSLFVNRNQLIYVLNFLPKVIPTKIDLVSLSKQRESLVITGVAMNHQVITNLLKQFKGNSSFKQVSLMAIKQVEKAGVVRQKFTIKFQLREQLNGLK